MPAEAFEVGERASREHDGEKRICEIIERKQLPNGQWSYYVHFEGLNRRLDSWVQAEELSPIEKLSALGSDAHTNSTSAGHTC